MQGSKIKPLRISASLILSLSDSGVDSNIFLMLIRKPHMSFQNSLVFPGGVCDTQDQKCSSQIIQFSKITAIRQTLQETGILLLPHGTTISNIQQLRLQYKERKFEKLNILILNIWSKHLDLIIPIVRFVTPQFPRMSRFDCLFYRPKAAVRVNLGVDGSLRNLNIHIEESSKYFWRTPQEYLHKMSSGMVYLPPPQLIILNYLIREPIITIPPSIEPFIGQIVDQIFILPGDKDYDFNQFDTLEPKSRTSQQISKYIKYMKQVFKKNTLRRIEGARITALIKLPHSFRVISSLDHQKTILNAINCNSITPKL